MESLIMRMAVPIVTILAVLFCFVACNRSDDAESCVVSSDCTGDLLFCNGDDVCVLGYCVQMGNPCSGSTPICDEALDICEVCRSNADCDDGLFCTGIDSCNLASGACINSGYPCGGTTPICDEALDICDECTSNMDCDDGLFCTGVETCDGGTGACFTTGFPCGGPTPTCNEVMDVCE